MGLIGKILPCRPWYLKQLDEEPEFAVTRLLYNNHCKSCDSMTSVCYIEDCEIIIRGYNCNALEES